MKTSTDHIAIHRYLKQHHPLLYSELYRAFDRFKFNERDATIDLSRLDQPTKRAVWAAIKTHRPQIATMLTHMDPDYDAAKAEIMAAFGAVREELNALMIIGAMASTRRKSIPRGTQSRAA